MEDVDKTADPFVAILFNSSVSATILLPLDHRFECEIPSVLLAPFLLISLLLGLLDFQNILVNIELKNLILEILIYLGYIGLFLLFLHYLQPTHH